MEALDLFIQNVEPSSLSKRELLSSSGKVVRKRKASATEIVVKQFLVPLHNKAKRQRLLDNWIKETLDENSSN